MKKLKTWAIFALMAICAKLGIAFGQKKSENSAQGIAEPEPIKDKSIAPVRFTKEWKQQQRALIGSTFYNEDGSPRVISMQRSAEISQEVFEELKYAHQDPSFKPGVEKHMPRLLPSDPLQASPLPVPFADREMPKSSLERIREAQKEAKGVNADGTYQCLTADDDYHRSSENVKKLKEAVKNNLCEVVGDKDHFRKKNI